ncbi:MAG: HAD hydrolase-like protein [Woeseiaceae bacterium]|nr:HAD hydrolase-like protein [Woeseiaceae bacterium]
MRAIIFDLDGTLLQSMTVDCELFEQSIEAILGPARFRDNYNCYGKVTDRGIVEELMTDNGFTPDADVVNSIRDQFVERLSNYIELSGPFEEVCGASKYIERLSIDEDTRVAIATGCWRDSAALKLRTSGIDVSRIPIASCDDSATRTEIMQIALARMDGRFDSVTYFGDAEWDVDACRTLGWKFVAVGSELRGITSYEGISH